MRIEEIKKLLENFYEGNTTVSQEEMLKEYFRTQDVPKHLENDQKLFQGFQDDIPVKVPAGLEERLIRLIDRKEEEEMRFFQRNKTRRNWRWTSGIAASILLLIGMGYSICNFKEDVEQRPKDTFNDPQVAYEVLQATLMEVSSGLNTGLGKVAETQKEIKRTSKEIKREISQQ